CDWSADVCSSDLLERGLTCQGLATACGAMPGVLSSPAAHTDWLSTVLPSVAVFAKIPSSFRHVFQLETVLEGGAAGADAAAVPAPPSLLRRVFHRAVLGYVADRGSGTRARSRLVPRLQAPSGT